MPVQLNCKYSPPLFYPATNASIVKYIDLTRFLSLLTRRALFFCRLSKLEDKFEGTTAKANFQYRVKWYEDYNQFQTVDKMTPEEIHARVIEDYKRDYLFKGLICVNCWNKNKIESAALWKIYSDFNK